MNMQEQTNIPGWRYYNHAAMPTTAPHEQPDLTPLRDGRIWKIGGGRKVWLVSYTTDFDMAVETPYWHIIKDGPFDINELSQGYRHKVRTALKRCEVRQIEPADYIEELYDCYHAAFKNYTMPENEMSHEAFARKCQTNNDRKVWAAFSREDGKLIGQMWCANRGNYTVTVMGKYHPDYMKLRASDAIHYAVLTHYLNELGQRYIDSGTRNISHHTGVQDYKEIHWHFRRAYCLLHIEYNPQIRWMIKCLFPLRRVLYACDCIKPVHKVNGIMRMEEIARACKRLKIED